MRCMNTLYKKAVPSGRSTRVAPWRNPSGLEVRKSLNQKLEVKTDAGSTGELLVNGGFNSQLTRLLSSEWVYY